MGRLLKGKVGVLLCLGLMLMPAATEREYFVQPSNMTWDEAREHCQVCFKELVTLTAENSQTIVQGLNSVHWIGLRKSLNSTHKTTSSSSNIYIGNSSMSWTHWANGDPLVFQNWYPGWPKGNCPYTCPCTCPVEPSSLNGTTAVPQTTEANNVTSTDHTPLIGEEVTAEAVCARTPALLLDENYIEDSCVMMLSFGAWVEKDCLERLPFICYDDRFIGSVKVTNLSTRTATLTWERASGNISHYRVEVNGTGWQENLTDFTYDLVSLTEGTRYSVQVFPVKCDRDLNPQKVTFYTIPNKVKGLEVSELTETSIKLSWEKPAGHVDFYRIKTEKESIEIKTEGKKFEDLTPGGCYTFTIQSGVQDKSVWSEESLLTVFTEPGKVSNLTVSENTNVSLLLSWEAPEGNSTSFSVTALNNSNYELFHEVVNKSTGMQKVRVTSLPMGTKITLVVAAQANYSLKGENVSIFNYTAPGPISNLKLTTKNSSLSATWIPPTGNCSYFTVKLLLDGEPVGDVKKVTEPKVDFDGLKTAANYTVAIRAVSGHLEGPAVARSRFTLPSPPLKAEATVIDKNTITFEWMPPIRISNATYGVKLSSSFWGHSWSAVVSNKTSHTFNNLKSGSKYLFEVHTVGDGLNSSAISCSNYTVTEEREIGLSMLCSSAESLLCDKISTRETVFNQLEAHIKKVFGDNIRWELEKQEIENKGAQ